jgi:AcrR family transcriptional regulator
MVTFQRARSKEQREARRQAILDTAAAMLDEMPVSEVTLNELSRRVGLAKSNVLRYFESREAILLELLDQAWKQWLTDLERQLAPGQGETAGQRLETGKGGDRADSTVRERGDRTAAVIAGSLDAQHVLCDLLSAQSSVLEHNVSTEVVVRYKRASIANLKVLAGLVQGTVPELGDDDSLRVALMTLAFVTAIWPAACSSPSVLAAYDSDPDLAVMKVGFAEALTEGTSTIISGTIARSR